MGSLLISLLPYIIGSALVPVQKYHQHPAAKESTTGFVEGNSLCQWHDYCAFIAGSNLWLDLCERSRWRQKSDRFDSATGAGYLIVGYCIQTMA